MRKGELALVVSFSTVPIFGIIVMSIWGVIFSKLELNDSNPILAIILLSLISFIVISIVSIKAYRKV
jgi:hypothetical protein